MTTIEDQIHWWLDEAERYDKLNGTGSRPPVPKKENESDG